MARGERELTQDIEITVDGKNIGLMPFVKEIMSNSIVGMVKALKGCENAEEITIKIRKNA